VLLCTEKSGLNPLASNTAKVKYGVRSPKSIWATCAQLYSLAETPQTPPSPPAFWAHIRRAIGHPRQATSLCDPLVQGLWRLQVDKIVGRYCYKT
jgi:hypothetical protein